MQEQKYSNREIDSKMESIHEKLDLILGQTTKHNGRMRSMEMWKARILGLMAGGTLILGMVVYIWNTKIVSIETSIDKVETLINNHIALK